MSGEDPLSTSETASMDLPVPSNPISVGGFAGEVWSRLISDFYREEL